jgi:hypothetical protein
MFLKNKKLTLKFTILALLSVIAMNCRQLEQADYVVVKTNEEIIIDGDISEKAWNAANVINGFIYPWKPEKAQSTTFRALYDGQFLYLAYQMEDDVIIAPDMVFVETDLIEQDRVEIYFAPDKMITEYYCIEMDVKGRKLDYKGKYHRQFDFAWEFNNMEHRGVYTGDGYQVEAAISLEALDDLGVIKNDAFYAGVYRADFHYGEDSTIVHVYASWLDPEVEEPDFHISTTLGIFHLDR